MAITVTQLTQGNLRLSYRPPGATAPNPEAWKSLIGQKPVSARLDTLPETKPRLSALLTSTIFQAAVAAFLVAIPMFFPDKLVTKIAYEVVPIAAPQTEVQLPPKPPAIRAKALPTPPPVVEPPPQPQRVAKLIAPRPLVAPKPKPVEVPEVKAPELPRINQVLTEAKFEAPPEPAKPREPVKTGNLNTGSAAPATVNKPIEQVQTGGFGDPKGLPGDSNPNKRANIGHFGSPALPPGPGYGNGTGGANGVRGTVASSGFGNGVAIAPTSPAGPTRGTVQAGGFQTASADAVAPKPKQADAASAVQEVVILEKPKPQYTDEARKLRIEGDVLVQVVFPASGPVQVIRVTKGLGHGLDEAAIQAAQQIRFKPALQDGKPVDFPATVHIEFQIAF
jgi:TonB family protein